MLLTAILLVILLPLAAGAGYLVGRRRSARTAHLPATDLSRPFVDAAPASLATLVTRTGAELAQIAVRTGVDLGNRALRDSLGTLSAWAQKERPDLRHVTGRDGTITLMFTDIEGSTALNERLGDDAWLEVLTAHDGVLRHSIRSAGGQVIKTQGDSFMAAFAEPAKGVWCAVDVQRTLLTLAVRDDVQLRVRIGLHTGEAIARGRDLFGINVATAARVAAEARGGEILLTEDVAVHVRDSRHLGRPRKLTLKGLSGAQSVVSVPWTEDVDDASPPVASRSSRRRRR